MFGEKGFDSWAQDYDSDVIDCDEKDLYPFAGYRKVLDGICQMIPDDHVCDILDIGFGTAVLTSGLYEKGHRIYGQDYSAKMCKLAKEKMETAQLYQKDFSEGLAQPLKETEYDYIIATYSLHHLKEKDKISFLHELSGLLKDGGKILIGDICFEDRRAMELCRETAGGEWDEDESYSLIDELKKEFPDMEFIRISFCGGIMIFNKNRS